MKVNEEKILPHYIQPFTQSLSKSITVANMFNKDILHSINKEGLLKKRVFEAKQNQLVSSISASNLQETASHSMPYNSISDLLAVKQNGPLLLQNRNKKKKKEEFNLVTLKFNELIVFIQNNNSNNISSNCKDIWRIVELELINKNFDSCDSVKTAIYTSWLLVCFSVILCYDIGNNGNNDNDNQNEYLNQIKSAFLLHIKIIKLIDFHKSLIFELKYQNQLANSIKSFISSICFCHKSCLKYYLQRKDNRIVCLWKQIPQVNYLALNQLFNQLINNGKTNNQESNCNRATATTLQIIHLPREHNKNYTLVLDLDQTLIYFLSDINDTGKGAITFRPGLIHFLDNVFPYYELILFTMGMPEYANPIINSIEKDRKYFQHRLFREHTTVYNKIRIKDLCCLGRDMKCILLIDDKEINFSLQKENGILIKPYTPQDQNDSSLIKLIPILITIAREKMDVRKGIAVYRDFILQNISCVVKGKL